MVVMDAIILMLSEKIGLNPGSVGESSIERAVSHRMNKHGFDDLSEYFLLLNKDANELVELIEEVVVPETWFFRNKIPFQAFVSHAKTQLLPRANKKKPIKILSIPCSTGEEPYSMAIALTEAGIHSQFFTIDAFDVSKKSISVAKSACYGKNSFRDVAKDIIEKYFHPANGTFKLNESICKMVQFKNTNILKDSLSPHPGFYDIIFCRNLLIYFDRENQKIAFEKLHRALKKDGILFVGHAEAAQVSLEFFDRSEYTKSFSFVKKNMDKSVKSLNGKNTIQKPRQVLTDEKKSSSLQWQTSFMKTENIGATSGITNLLKNRDAAGKPINRGAKTGPKETPAIIQSLRPIEKLVKENNYDEAYQKCLAYLDYQPDSAHGHYLLGQIKNQQGENKAAESLLKKAIYLDPNHEQALELLCGIAEKSGDVDAENSYKRRLARVKSRSKGDSAKKA